MGAKRLLIPGPTDVLPDVLLQQTRPMISHRGSEYTALYSGIIDKLGKYFATGQNITVHTSSGTIWMDITGRNIVKKKALACVNGSFSERMYLTIKDCGKEADALSVEWGKAIKPEMVLEKLAGGGYDTVAVCHNETSTGVRSPVAEIGEAIKKEHPEVMFVVDAVSSAGGDLLEPEKLKTDVLFTSSQKCFALPPGLSMGIVSPAALQRAKEVPGRGHYTDLIAIFDYYAKSKQNPTTPNISLLYALDLQLDRMLKETAQKRYERHLAMAEITRKWGANNKIEMFPEKGFESITVSTMKNSLGKNIGDLNKELGKRGYMIANGYGKLKDQTFRIGHMGDWTPDEIKALLLNVDDIWGL
jgi:aspartate aminotransferase-like enzyme